MQTPAIGGVLIGAGIAARVVRYLPRVVPLPAVLFTVTAGALVLRMRSRAVCFL
ncbi:hypothetical protein OG792_00645 [Micromonospora sp. NBC_01699]|uniref:hypothetical protein n=1 Tax=Micromonospora sp. NBC_01699 TaxID=2975984 RepID=UPI002E2B47A4|nr:hypothetical protein [Micromonospora sp. NBC_01699]